MARFGELARHVLMLALGAAVLFACKRYPDDERRCLAGDVTGCQAACWRGVRGGSGCARLVRAYQSGINVPRDEVAARALSLLTDDPQEIEIEWLSPDRRELHEHCRSLAVPKVTLTPFPQTVEKIVRARLACDTGDENGCVELARILLDDNQLPWQPSYALAGQVAALLKPRCEAGRLDACLLISRAAGTLRHEGAELIQTALRRACAGGRAEACAQLANHESQPGRALELLTGACDGGAPLGCYDLAVRVRRGTAPGGPKRQQALAQRFLSLALKQCQGGDTWACRELVSKLSRETLQTNGEPQGIGFRRPLDELAKGQAAPRGQSPARLWIQRFGCEAGDAEACANMGSTWAGQGDRDRAAEHFEAGCKLGSPPACIRLAAFLGSSNPRAVELAAAGCAAGFRSGCTMPPGNGEDHERLCALGAAAACQELTRGGTPSQRALACLATGTDCDKLASSHPGLTDECQRELHVTACHHDVVDSCLRVGEAHRTGKGARRDPDRAYRFLLLATERWPSGIPRGVGPVLHEQNTKRLAGYLERGDGLPRDERKAAWLLAQLCADQERGCDEVVRLLGQRAEPVAGAWGEPCRILPEGAWCPQGQCVRRREVGEGIVAVCAPVEP